MPNKLVIIKLFFLLCLISFVPFVLACNKNNTYTVIQENGFYIVKVNINSAKIEPYVSDKLETVYDIAKKSNAKVVLNAGFFDAKNAKTVSYVFKNANLVSDPQKNDNLTSNKELQPYLDKIYDRGEFRILNCNSALKTDIVYHSAQLPDGCELISSVQAGPVVLPDMDLEKEFFVLKKNGKVIRDGAGMTRKTDRSLIALKGNEIWLIITDEKNPLTIYELQNKIKPYGFDKALGFDGGGSVSLFVKQKDGEFYQCREKNNTSRPVKSALLVY